MALAENMSGSADEELMRALLRLRFFVLSHLIELGDSASQAVAVGEPLAADVERLLGSDHSDTLLAWDSLAVAYRAVGRNAEAIPLLEQTLTTGSGPWVPITPPPTPPRPTSRPPTGTSAGSARRSRCWSWSSRGATRCGR